MILFSVLISPICAFISFILVIAAQSVCDFYQISNISINATDILPGLTLQEVTVKNGIWQGFDIELPRDDSGFSSLYGGCHQYTDDARIISTTGAQKAGMAFSILTLISLLAGLMGMLLQKKTIAMVGVVLALMFNMLMFVVFEDCNSRKGLDNNIFGLDYVTGKCALGSGSIISIVTVILLVVSLTTTYQCCALPVEGQATPGGEAAAGTEVKEEAGAEVKEEAEGDKE